MQNQHRARAAIAALATAGLVAGCGSSSAEKPQPGPAAQAQIECQAAKLKLSSGPPISPMTGEDGRLYALTNESSEPCFLALRPRVTFFAHGMKVPFVVGPGNGNYVSKRAPRRVILTRAATAFFLVAKYRCDGGNAFFAQSLIVRLGTQRPSLILTGEAAMYPYCRSFAGDSAADPGNVVEVSAIEASPYAANRLTVVPQNGS